jgi:serine/threonine-protein kinase
MGRYQVVRCLAHGGMGAVYEVIHQETERPLALKVLLPIVLADADARGRFAQEARVTARVQSDHIVDVVDAGVDPETGMPFLVMELLHGDDLGALIARGPLASGDAVLLLAQAAVALDRCHAANIVHRDLKPANIMITQRDDGSPRTKILDFGVAKVVKPGALTTGTRSVGTTLYMAPEQLTGDHAISPAADRYSLAQLAFTMLAGKAYFHEEAAELEPYPLLAVVAEGPRESACARARREGVRLPRAFDAWFARATELEPDRRPESAAELIVSLAAALGVETPPFLASRAGAPRSTREKRGRTARRPTLIIGLALLVAAAAAATYAALPGTSDEAIAPGGRADGVASAIGLDAPTGGATNENARNAQSDGTRASEASERDRSSAAESPTGAPSFEPSPGAPSPNVEATRQPRGRPPATAAGARGSTSTAEAAARTSPPATGATPTATSALAVESPW